jgi:hypothetical protein
MTVETCVQSVCVRRRQAEVEGIRAMILNALAEDDK